VGGGDLGAEIELFLENEERGRKLWRRNFQCVGETVGSTTGETGLGVQLASPNEKRENGDWGEFQIRRKIRRGKGFYLGRRSFKGVPLALAFYKELERARR